MQSRLPFPVVTARLSLTYGPAQSENFLIPSLISRRLASRHLCATRRASDLIYVDDVVEALLRLSSTDTPGGTIINIASGNAPTMRETAMKIIAATEADPSLVEFRADSSEDVDLLPSPEFALELLDWKARIPLHQGIGLTVASYRAPMTDSRRSRQRRYRTLMSRCNCRTANRETIRLDKPRHCRSHAGTEAANQARAVRQGGLINPGCCLPKHEKPAISYRGGELFAQMARTVRGIDDIAAPADPSS